MPKTIQQARVEAAALVIAEHNNRLGIACDCGQVPWTPLHVAEELSKAGCLGPRRVVETS